MRQNTVLQHKSESFEQQQAQVIHQLSQQHADLMHEHGALLQQCVVLAQPHDGLAQQHIAQGQELENTRHQLHLSLQANGSLQQEHHGLHRSSL